MNVTGIRILSAIFSCMLTEAAFCAEKGQSQPLLKQVLLKGVAKRFEKSKYLDLLIQDTEAGVLRLLPNRATLHPWSHPDRLTITQLGLSTDVEKNEGKMLVEFSPNELERKEISVTKQGALMYVMESGFGLRLNSDENYIWVMLPTGQIFATKEFEVDSSELGFRKVHHSALLHGIDKLIGPVASGSFRVFPNGKIRTIDEKSGHYAPRGRVELFIDELEARMGERTFLNESTKIKNYDGEDSLSRVDLTRYTESELNEVLRKAWGDRPRS